MLSPFHPACLLLIVTSAQSAEPDYVHRRGACPCRKDNGYRKSGRAGTGTAKFKAVADTSKYRNRSRPPPLRHLVAKEASPEARC
jgi:hypothetical protein